MRRPPPPHLLPSMDPDPLDLWALPSPLRFPASSSHSSHPPIDRPTFSLPSRTVEESCGNGEEDEDEEEKGDDGYGDLESLLGPPVSVSSTTPSTTSSLPGDTNGKTPLIVSCQSGRRELAALLLAGGVKADGVSDASVTALVACSMNGDREMAELLLSNGATADLPTNNGDTSLAVSCQNGHGKVAELLLANGAAVDRATNDGDTPFTLSSKNGQIGIAELLLAGGARVNHAMNSNGTSFTLSSKNGDRDVVRLLLAIGAKADQADAAGTTVCPSLNSSQGIRASFARK